MSSSEDISIVDYYGGNEGYKCGYCKSENTNCSHGMWAYSLTVQDYQDLIDRGWRRSGCYCYKPTMNITCCPAYTIKCAVNDFKLSKSKKKKIKKFNNFLAHGRNKTAMGEEENNESTSESGDDAVHDIGINEIAGLKENSDKALSNIGNASVNSFESSFRDKFSGFSKNVEKEIKTLIDTSPSVSTDENVSSSQEKEIHPKCPMKTSARPGDGMDPNRPQCKKAKLLRKERKEKKLAMLSPSKVSSLQTKPPPAAKTLEDHLNEPLPESPAHRLEIRLVRSFPASKEFNSSFQAEFEVYKRYQTTIHNEPESKVNERQFTRFLVNSPLKPYKPADGPPQGYGSFHQQYWLDGQLIAVGVIDILPFCISSVYFFYDPEFQFLVLGTYGSLREIAFCRSLSYSVPSLRYYYMGFYIHSCPKMRYKGAYHPSLLLCPEVYDWHPIEYCIPRLDKSKYCRFNQDPQFKDPDQIDNLADVSVLFQNKAMHYNTFLSFNSPQRHFQQVTEYASLVGNKLAKRMLLILTQ